jgi:hypothetical protein
MSQASASSSVRVVAVDDRSDTDSEASECDLAKRAQTDAVEASQATRADATPTATAGISTQGIIRGMRAVVDGIRDNAVPQALGGNAELGDFWTPLPRGVSKVMRTFKDLKESVVEVIRITGVELTLHPDVVNVARRNEVFYVTCSIVGKNAKYSRRCCGRQKYSTYHSFELKLQPSNDGLMTSGLISQVGRVPRLTRRKGNMTIRLQLGVGKDTYDTFSALPARDGSGIRHGPTAVQVQELASYDLPLPAYWNKQELSLEYDPDSEDQLFVHRRSTMTNRNSRQAALKDDSIFTQTTAKITLMILSTQQVFDANRCKPSQSLFGGLYNEWRPSTARQWAELWTSPWTDMCLVRPAELLAAMMAEMKHDSILIYQTLFAQSSRHPPSKPPMSRDDDVAHDRRVLFLKRLILCLAVARVTYCVLENGTSGRRWPFPLSALLSHGNRILVRLDGVKWDKFINFLLFGNDDAHNWEHGAPPSPFTARLAATHAIGLHPRKCQLYERKLKKRNAATNLKDGLTGHHLGLDLPVGGLGNRAPMTGKNGEVFYVGPAGVPFSREADGTCKYAEDVQHGHLYLRWDDFGYAEVPVLMSSDKTKSGAFDTFNSNADGMKHAAKGVKTDWFQLPALHTKADLETLLRQHGYVSALDDKLAFDRLYHQIVVDNELALQSNEKGMLRCRGVLIHLVVENEDEGEEKVLVHLGATCLEEVGKVQSIYRRRHDNSAPDSVRLRITIKSASGLRAADWNGKSDPYCKCHVQGRPKSGFKTRAIKKTLEPQWEEEGEITDYIPGEALQFSVWDHDLLTRDDRLGHAMLAAADVERGFDGSIGLLEAGSGDARLWVKVEHICDFVEKDLEPSIAHTPHAPNAPVSVEDVCMPTMLRKRHESWPEALTRCVQNHLNVSTAVADKLVEYCRKAEDEMCIYRCEGAPTLCHHHCSNTAHIDVEYQAFRFIARVDKHDHELLAPILHMNFQTTEGSVDLHGFGGHPPAEGSVTREWGWMSKAEATRRNVRGLYPPEDRLEIVHETGHLSALLIGTEGCAPSKKSFFGSTHSAKAASAEIAAYGGRKWRDYRKGGQEVPADIGGMHCVVDEVAFDNLQRCCDVLNLRHPSEGYTGSADERYEKNVFRELLTLSHDQAEAYLRGNGQFTRNFGLVGTNTGFLEGYVREVRDHPTDSTTADSKTPAPNGGSSV